eukprot:m.21405 g.21405  ORF g.21405 m.21405 type:complete len:478 (-) comp13377_c0_seq1:369-1802(-)
MFAWSRPFPTTTERQHTTIMTDNYDEDRADGESFETMQLHYGQPLDAECRARAPPIYSSTSFCFEDSGHGADLFALKKLGFIYSRLMNPTTHIFEHRVAKLEGSPCPLGTAHPPSLATASGQAAQMHALLTICSAGDNFVCASELYGGTYTQFKYTFANMGVEARFIDGHKTEDIQKNIDENTKCVYYETLSNPSYSVPDFEKITEICKENKIPFVVDNTFGMCGYTCRPLKFGANIVVESATKWIGGHGNTIGGVITDGCNFDWGVKKADGSPKFPKLSEPCPAYHGMNFWEVFGPDGPFKVNMAFIFHCRTNALRDMGGCQNPFGSFLLLQGLETLSLRGKAHSENANALAAWLEKNDAVEWVNHPSLASHQANDRAKKYFREGCYGSVLCFGPKGGAATASKVINSLKLCSHLANVGDAKTLVIQPSTTTHQQLTEEQQVDAGVKPDMIRVSVGIENIKDIIADFTQAFAEAAK